MTNPLDPTMAWFEVIKDSMKATDRVISRRIPRAVTKRHVFHPTTPEDSLQKLEEAAKELNDLVVLGLVATFERTLRDFVMRRPACLLVGGDPIDAAIHAAILNDVEYWRIADRLIGVFRGRVTPELLGEVKQIIGYRNWVAHGRATTDPPDGNVTSQ